MCGFFWVAAGPSFSNFGISRPFLRSCSSSPPPSVFFVLFSLPQCPSGPVDSRLRLYLCLCVMVAPFPLSLVCVASFYVLPGDHVLQINTPGFFFFSLKTFFPPSRLVDLPLLQHVHHFVVFPLTGVQMFRANLLWHAFPPPSFSSTSTPMLTPPRSYQVWGEFSFFF